MAAGAADTVVSGKFYISETFGQGWEDRWTTSKWKESEGTVGKWVASAGKWHTDEAEDTGIQTGEDSRFFGVSAGSVSFSNKDKTLIVQSQAKYEKDVECGGGYLTLGPKSSDAAFGAPTPYNIRFGPDKCGYTKRTHLIFNYRGKNVLQTTDLAYKQEDAGTSPLYRLVVHLDYMVRVETAEETIYEGSIKEDWEVLAPKEIPAPDDVKPSYWVDDSMMDSPEDTKPDEWADADRKRIVDETAKKPDSWDDEEDGDWEAPLTENPTHKGEWLVEWFSNPGYKGFWEARKITNPAYVDDDAMYKSDAFGFFGIGLWLMKGGTSFDNHIVMDDVAAADAFAPTWKALREHEDVKKKEEDAAKKAESEKKEEKVADDDDAEEGKDTEDL